MGGDVETIKDRLDIAEVISGYIKLEKAGQSFKARCPFHGEKTPSFFVSPTRQNFYCFGCGAKGDIFTFVEDMEGIEFRDALKLLAEKAGVELTRGTGPSRTDKDEVRSVLELATEFFEKNLADNKEALSYLRSRGITDESIKKWRLGFALSEWRSLYGNFTSLGHSKELLVKSGLVKKVDGADAKEPYDVFRNRIIFPLSDPTGRVIAFSGRALDKDAIPKYLNSPDTLVFTKSEVLYGLDKAKDEIRKKNYTVLVEGQMDLVLSHQAGVPNTVATSGTAFTRAHLERLKRLSSRVIFAFDGDSAGEQAAEKSAILAMSLGMEAKIAPMPEGKDPADLARDDPEKWKNVLRQSSHAVEFFLNKILEREKDSRKVGQSILKKILPLIALVESSIERSHFISIVAKRSGIKEEILWDDLRKVKVSPVERTPNVAREEDVKENKTTHKEKVLERLDVVNTWIEELPKNDAQIEKILKEKQELEDNLDHERLREELSLLVVEIGKAEKDGTARELKSLTSKAEKLHKEIRALEERRQ